MYDLRGVDNGFEIEILLGENNQKHYFNTICIN